MHELQARTSGEQPKKLSERELCEISDAITPFHRFYATPDFEVEEPTMNPTLVHAFYDLNIIIFSRLEPNFDFEYLRKNFLAPSDITTPDQLVKWFIQEKRNYSRNDSRYLLGFRSTAVVLDHNKENLTPDFIELIHTVAKPFIDSYKYQEDLNGKTWVELYDEEMAHS